MPTPTDLSDDAALVLRDISRAVHTARKDERLTMSQLAEKAGVSRYTVSKIEDRVPVSGLALAQVLAALGLTVAPRR